MVADFISPVPSKLWVQIPPDTGRHVGQPLEAEKPPDIKGKRTTVAKQLRL
jgi:hypothetical protein